MPSVRKRKYHMLQVRLSPREKEMLEKLAAHESQTLSEWVRFVIRAEYRWVLPAPGPISPENCGE